MTTQLTVNGLSAESITSGIIELAKSSLSLFEHLNLKFEHNNFK